MGKLTAITFIFMAMAGQAHAGQDDQASQCQNDVARIDEALASEQLAADVRSQVEDLRSEAVQFCGAGSSEEGAAAAAEALALIARQ